MNCDDIVVKNIRTIIDQNGYKQKAVAKEAKIPENIFYSITSGRKRLDSGHILQIARALHVTPNVLYGIEAEQKPRS